MGRIPNMPDLPVLKHLTYREAHLFELGVWPGIGVGIALAGFYWGTALSLVSIIRRAMRDKDQLRDAEDLVKGYRRDAWYLAAGAFFGLFVGFSLAFLSKALHQAL